MNAAPDLREVIAGLERRAKAAEEKVARAEALANRLTHDINDAWSNHHSDAEYGLADSAERHGAVAEELEQVQRDLRAALRGEQS